MTTNSHSHPQGLVTPHSYPCTHSPEQKVQTWLPQVPSTSSGKFLLNPCVTIHSKRTMTWSLWSKQMKIWKFKRFAFGVQVPSMLYLYQKFTVCWVFPRKDLYESIRRPFLHRTSIMKVYVLCVYMRYMYLVTQLCLTLLWLHGL